MHSKLTKRFNCCLLSPVIVKVVGTKRHKTILSPVVKFGNIFQFSYLFLCANYILIQTYLLAGFNLLVAEFGQLPRY